jgi:hypothetical protein
LKLHGPHRPAFRTLFEPHHLKWSGAGIDFFAIAAGDYADGEDRFSFNFSAEAELAATVADVVGGGALGEETPETI